uniref:Large ribosomal subunit protein bL19m n=1 Tax=Syphacia muris TaxID=451379 RepID=A0A0N5AWI0_9BILA
MDNYQLDSTFVINERVRCLLKHILEVTLRLPVVVLLEIWLRNKDVYVISEAFHNSPLSSYIEINAIIRFIQTRNFDQAASVILSYAVLFLFSIFLSLPLKKLLWIYAHFISICLLGIAHYLSARYVHVEQSGDPEIRLDDVKKLEWHGSHILAQLMLCVAQSCLLGLESDVERLMLSVFLIPIFLRMSGISLGRLILAHNIACSLAMLNIFIYALNRAPKLLMSIRHFYHEIKNAISNQGIIRGTVVISNNLYFGELLSCAWILLFSTHIYVELNNKGEKSDKFIALTLSAIAESTITPLSLLAFALTVKYGCSFLIKLSRRVVGGNYESDHFLIHTGYTEVLILVFLCSQTGFLSMPLGQKAFLLGLMFLIVISSLLQSVYKLLKTRLMELGGTPVFLFNVHLPSLLLAAVLFSSCVLVAVVITNYLPTDLWSVIMASDSILTALRILSVVIIYALTVLETRMSEYCESCEGMIFFTKLATYALELVLTACIVIYGVYSLFEEQWSLVKCLMLVFHSYFNIWKAVQKIITNLKIRWAAKKNMSLLPKASLFLLREKKDFCAICCEEMVFEARITPCKHFFHEACLRRKMSVGNLILRNLAVFLKREFASLCCFSSESTGLLKNSSRRSEKCIDDKIKHIKGFPYIYPDFIPTSIPGRRNALKEELERADMLERRVRLDIPEFYVGSIMAVTLSDQNMGNRQNRFLGICIRRERPGLFHQFTLRNVIDGLGVEVMYELYNPTILKIEVIKLEKRLDDDLSYLIDALPEYSTFNQHMEPVIHPAGSPVPINPLKMIFVYLYLWFSVKMRPPPWSRRWEMFQYDGIEDGWSQVTPWFKRKLYRGKINDLRKYDLIADYREARSDLETELQIEAEMRRFERKQKLLGTSKKPILRSAADIFEDD